MDFSVVGVLKGVAYKPTKAGAQVVITLETEGTNMLARLGMFVGQEVGAEFRMGGGEERFKTSGRLAQLGYTPAGPESTEPKVQIRLKVPGDAVLGGLGMAVGHSVGARYTPWQLALEDGMDAVVRDKGGQMPLGATPDMESMTITNVSTGESVTLGGKH